MLLAQRVDGLILVPQGGDNANVEMLASSGLPAVFVDRVIDDIDLPSVTADNSSGMGEAVQHLATLGHRRIGYISGPRSASTGRERFAAFQAATLDCGLERDPELVVFGDFQAGSGAAGARQLLELTNAPTALIAADGLMTMGAVRVCQELGIRIGEDLSLVGYDDIDAFAIMRPALTLIAQDADEMGRTAVRLLHEVIAGQRPEPVVLPTRLMVRKSTGPAKTGVNR